MANIKLKKYNSTLQVLNKYSGYSHRNSTDIKCLKITGLVTLHLVAFLQSAGSWMRPPQQWQCSHPLVN